MKKLFCRSQQNTNDEVHSLTSTFQVKTNYSCKISKTEIML